MFSSLNRKTAIVASASAVCAMVLSIGAVAGPRQAEIDAPPVVELAPANFEYVLPGEFTRADKPDNAPRLTVKFKKPVVMMKRQVTAAEYQRCVDDHVCASTDGASERRDMPAVLVSWLDATAYAGWLSAKLGVKYRLPTDEEWTFAAGSHAPDEEGFVVDPDNPAKTWLSRYAREANADPTVKEPQPIGYFGANEHGLLDVGGNVWEWTSTCYSRTARDDAGRPTRAVTRNCGVRIAEGGHRAYITDFIRDARGGGCAVGTPPSNLGFRLVRDDIRSWWLF
jgi:formylglycine-generating enzyme required for sulfatase activity